MNIIGSKKALAKFRTDEIRKADFGKAEVSGGKGNSERNAVPVNNLMKRQFCISKMKAE